ncbi:hypothetical protein FORC066_0149 [Yersinia enterocolitica]|nr:hypothetical protein FORC065_0132 [Yersinia enterocolitica]UXD27371.1 hypothetical protein FORC066_0149 [Yersinia enterocolitica]
MSKLEFEINKKAALLVAFLPIFMPKVHTNTTILSPPD